MFVLVNFLDVCHFRCLFVFVCLSGRSMRGHNWVLMGADLNKVFRPGYKSFKICVRLSPQDLLPGSKNIV